MINNKKILAIIPARGGSKGMKNKNIKDLAGKPLLGYTIEAALKSKFIDNIIVSTDSPKIHDVALKYGAKVPFLRPAELATDTTKTINVLIHTVAELKRRGDNYEILVLLQATSPLRNNLDIDYALELFVKKGYRSLASVHEVENYPILIRSLDENNEITPIFNERSDQRRQDVDKYFYVNGAIYINKISELSNETSLNNNEIGYVMPKERSIDIDEEMDLAVAEVLLKIKNEKF